MTLWSRLKERYRKRRRGADSHKFFEGYETRSPSYQNAIDATPGWNMSFPPELGLKAGALALYSDHRIGWAMERFGDLTGRSVLELGPLEGGHTYMLDKAGALVEALEAQRMAYFRCLITKEILDIRNARFLLGDFQPWLEENTRRFDLVVASGVLYHTRDPLNLLYQIARCTDAVFIWTMYIKDDSKNPSHVVEYEGVKVRMYQVVYENPEQSASFCGGVQDRPVWMHRDDLLAVLPILGFNHVETAHEGPAGEFGQSFSIFARRVMTEAPVAQEQVAQDLTGEEITQPGGEADSMQALSAGNLPGNTAAPQN